LFYFGTTLAKREAFGDVRFLLTVVVSIHIFSVVLRPFL
jgi:hypothetical protein